MARFRVTQWNGDKLLLRAGQILEEFGLPLASQAEIELAKDQYPWPERRSDGSLIVTERKNGQFVTSPRNIIDTATLLNSATRPTVTQARGGRSRLRIEWTAPYSKAVQQGGYVIGSGARSYVAPERDWIAKTYEQLKPTGATPFLPFLVQRWQALAKGGKGRA